MPYICNCQSSEFNGTKLSIPCIGPHVCGCWVVNLVLGNE